jgi:hypothetical protein
MHWQQSAPLRIIYKIDVRDIDTFETPRDAPIGAHGNRPIIAPPALQRVQSHVKQERSEEAVLF